MNSFCEVAFAIWSLADHGALNRAETLQYVEPRVLHRSFYYSGVGSAYVRSQLKGVFYRVDQ